MVERNFDLGFPQGPNGIRLVPVKGQIGKTEEMDTTTPYGRAQQLVDELRFMAGTLGTSVSYQATTPIVPGNNNSKKDNQKIRNGGLSPFYERQYRGPQKAKLHPLRKF